MPKGAEQKLQTLCRKYFERTAEIFGLKLDERVSVLSDVTYLKHGDSFKMTFGFAQVDLAFYRPITLDKKHFEPASDFRFLRVAKRRRGTINIPFLVLELKRGGSNKKGLVSDAIRSRTIVARGIKQIFPFCAYMFLADSTNKQDHTVIRQGKDFTNYFRFPHLVTEEELAKIDKNFIRPHLRNLRAIDLL